MIADIIRIATRGRYGVLSVLTVVLLTLGIYVSPEARAAAPVQTYTQSVRGSCQGHGYTLTGTFQFDPNTNRRRGIAGKFQGDNWTQVIHDFQVGATSSGGAVLSPNKVVDSIAGSASVSGKWGTGVQVSVYMRVYRTLYRCAGGIGA